MNIFTANQVSQFYYLLANSGSGGAFKSPSDLTRVGDFYTTVEDGNLFICQKGHGGVVRSDLIPLKNIEYCTYVAASSDSYQTKLWQIQLQHGYNLVAGEDYMLRIAFDNYIGISPEDSQYWKYGVVRATTGMSSSDFYKAMAISLYKNMSREAYKPILIGLNTSNGAVEVNASSIGSLTGTYIGILIAENVPEWTLGLKQEKRVGITITAMPVEIPSEANPYRLIEEDWASIVEETPDSNRMTVTNGRKVADLEYFWMGERGDQYRMVGFPDYIPTKYCITDTTRGYNILRIHFSYTGANECVQKSEKDIILVSTSALMLKRIENVANGLSASTNLPAQEPDAVYTGGDPFAIGN